MSEAERVCPCCAGMRVRIGETISERLAFIHVDDSPVALLQPRRTAYAWVYLGDVDNPYTLFDFTAGRGEKHPAAFLSGYSGFVHADGYTGYNPIHGSGARHLGCWAHVRRKFVEARPNSAAEASEALAYIRTLYAVEQSILDEKMAGHAVVSRRQTRAGPILRRLGVWLDAEQSVAFPKSPLRPGSVVRAQPVADAGSQPGRCPICNR